MFATVEPYLGDPIFSLVEAFKRDPNPKKINLSIGFYYDDSGQVPQLESVKKALDHIFSDHREHPSLYLPMQGREDYGALVTPLILGEEDPAIEENRVALIQSLGGSGALRIGADFLHRYSPESTVYVSDPTWANHLDIFRGVGFSVERYPYFDRETLKVDFEAMLQFFNQMERNDIAILHPCCHNPTGADLDRAEWAELLDLIKERGVIPFFDIAYQGFGDGIEADLFAVKMAAEREIPFLLSSSFSKTFSLYGERIGALLVRCESSTIRNNVFGQLRATVRRNYSNPPTLGMKIVSTILGDEALKSEWFSEVEEMRLRIIKMREALVNRLQEGLSSDRFNHLLTQKGMFGFTGLTPAEIGLLRERHSIYLLNNGRICISGLTSSNVIAVADAIIDVVKQ